MLLPPCVDDYVSARNPVRAIDACVGTLDLEELGCRHAEEHCGAVQPAYDPGLLLKLYLYGYQHRVRSSRRLETETRRNLEVIWLCQGGHAELQDGRGFPQEQCICAAGSQPGVHSAVPRVVAA